LQQIVAMFTVEKLSKIIFFSKSDNSIVWIIFFYHNMRKKVIYINIMISSEDLPLNFRGDTSQYFAQLGPSFPLLADPIVLHHYLYSYYHFQFHLSSVVSLSTHPGGNETAQENHFTQSQDGFTCSNCSKWFKHLSNFKRHILVHTGEKPFQCPACPHSFRRNYLLKSHVQRMHPDVTIPISSTDFNAKYNGNK